MNTQRDDSNEVEDRLQRLKSQHLAQHQAKPQAQSQAKPDDSPSTTSEAALEQIRSRFTSKQPRQSDKSPKNSEPSESSESSAIDELKQQLSAQRQTRDRQQTSSSQHQAALRQLKQKHQQQRDRPSFSYDQNLADIRKTEQQQQRRRKQFTRQAQQWLDTIDACSSEGLWFEQLAASYPSRLEAAIDYLQALEDAQTS